MNAITRYLLAKNKIGYQNLIKLTSLGYIEGMYSKYPRIDKELIEKYHEGLIATTCCIGAYVPQTILHEGEEKAEKEFKWWLDLFGEDYFIELQRHNIKEQEKINQMLLKFAKKYNVRLLLPTTVIIPTRKITMHTIFFFALIQAKKKARRVMMIL